MIPCPPEAIIFDMDGTLVDSEKLWQIVETNLLAAYGATYDPGIQGQNVGLDTRKYVEALRVDYNLDVDWQTLYDDLIARMTARIATESTPMPGAQAMIDWVKEKGYPHAIASSSPVAIIDATVNAVPGWAAFFTVRCSAEHVPHGKPDPDVYLFAADKLGVDPTQCITFEDSRNGARAAVAAGMTCFAVPDTFHTPADAFGEITPLVYNDLHAVLVKLKECLA